MLSVSDFCVAYTFFICNVPLQLFLFHNIMQGLVGQVVKNSCHLSLCILVPPSSVQNKLHACDVTSLFNSHCLLKKPRHTSDSHLLKINTLLVRQHNLFILMINKEANAPQTEWLWMRWLGGEGQSCLPGARIPAHAACAWHGMAKSSQMGGSWCTPPIS